MLTTGDFFCSVSKFHSPSFHLFVPEHTSTQPHLTADIRYGSVTTIRYMAACVYQDVSGLICSGKSYSIPPTPSTSVCRVDQVVVHHEIAADQHRPNLPVPATPDGPPGRGACKVHLYNLLVHSILHSTTIAASTGLSLPGRKKGWGPAMRRESPNALSPVSPRPIPASPGARACGRHQRR